MTFECKFCFASFKRERAFMTHTCMHMERASEIKTVTGQSAYQYYCVWLEKQKRKPPVIETFMTSMYYSAFIKFVNFVKRVSIANVDKYVELMCNNKIAPINWDHNDAYAIYLEWNDRRSTPMEQAEITFETLLKLSEILEVSINEVFDKLTFNEIFQLLHERRLSPWVLLCSAKFKTWLKTQDNDDHKRLINLLGIDYWANKFEINKNDVANIKRLTEEIGI